MALILRGKNRFFLLLCDVLSVVYYRLDRRGRRRALEILRIVRGTCRGDEGTSQFDPDYAPYDATCAEDCIIRRSYRNMTRAVGDLLWTRGRSSRVRRAGELGDAARDFTHAHHSAISLSGHLGSWEILPQLVAQEGWRMMSVAKAIGPRWLTRLINRLREAGGPEIVASEGAFKALMTGLKHGKSVGLLVDQPVDPEGDGGIWIRFLGKPYPVSPAPALLAARSNVPIVVAWARPQPDGRAQVEIVATYTPDQAREVWATTQRIAANFERLFRRHPSCCVLNYNYFSNIPSAADEEGLCQRERLGGRTDARDVK